LRFEELDSKPVRKSINKMATQTCKSLDRNFPNIPPESKHEIAIQKPNPAEGQVPIIVVDQMNRGDYATISQAIAAAKPGSKILVRPGVYDEGLSINKPLEIVGDGDLGTVIVRAKGKDAIIFGAAKGKVSNIALKQIGGGKWYGVDISQGCLELEKCDITSDSEACVAIHGNAYPILRENTIHDGKAGGVYVYENGQGVIENNEIFGNALAGIEIKEGCNPIVRDNKIHDGKESGVFIYENGQGVIENNDIFSNAGACLRLVRAAIQLSETTRSMMESRMGLWFGKTGWAHSRITTFSAMLIVALRSKKVAIQLFEEIA